MLEDTAEVKGYVLLSYATPLQKHEPGLWSQVLSRLDDEARGFFTEPIFASNWYPRRHMHRLFEAYSEVSADPESDFRKLGAMAAEHQLNSIYKLFLTFATPAAVFKRATSVWSRQTSVGRFRVLETADDHLVGELIDPNLPVGVPDVIAGWSDAIIETLRRTPTRTTYEKCGPTRWRFNVGWESN